MGSTSVPRLVREVFGTALLVFVGVSAALTSGSAVGAAIGVLVAAAAAVWIFGGHFNPWLTIASALRGGTSWIKAVFIIVAQLVGGLAGGLLVWLTLGDKGVAAGLGVNRLAADATAGKGLVAAIAAEAIAVFVLACVVFATEKGDRGGIGMGFGYAIGVLSIGAITSASLNLARTIGTELSLSIAGGSSDWSQVWVYLAGGLIGAILAGLFADKLRTRK